VEEQINIQNSDMPLMKEIKLIENFLTTFKQKQEKQIVLAK